MMYWCFSPHVSSPACGLMVEECQANWCVTKRAKIQAALQSERLQLRRKPRDTSIQGESLQIFKKRQKVGQKPFRHVRNQQAI